MNRKLITASVLSTMVLMSVACCSKKKAQTSGSEAATSKTAAPPQQTDSNIQPATTPKQNQMNNEQNFRLVVSFISKGAGTDGKAHEKFKEFLENYNPKVEFEFTPWGREGEKDYCLKLGELSKENQERFVNEVKTLVGSSDRVFIVENSECRHKR